MVGGGSRRDDGSFTINNSNVFAALDTLRKKKKEKKSSTSSKSSLKAPTKEQEPQFVWTPTPLNAKSWADVEDEDDDDYYATTAPPTSVWGAPSSKPNKEPAPAIEVCILYFAFKFVYTVVMIPFIVIFLGLWSGLYHVDSLVLVLF